ncbi:MFS transporter [Phenylobacterium sp.]|uniref:MFS transporter n=1 Tax=Phenylobacterium sp. TaxID=1871053 RepID=UPI0025EC586C|nr:MFS transporter [Phenylobacterium sp.]MCA6343072.1 MFS transporter [Phenylobacterium sp.]
MQAQSGAKAGYGEFKLGWPVVASAMLGIGLGLSPLPFYTIGILAPELAREFGWGFAEILGGLPIMTFAVLLASPLVGLLADRIGVRTVALWSLGLFGLAFAGFAASNGNITLFYVTWGIMALVGAGTLPVTWTRAVNNRFDVHKGLALGLSLVGTGLFGFVCKPYTAWLVEEFGWRVAYLGVAALPLLIALPIAFIFFHDVGGRTVTAAERRVADAERKAVTPGLSFGQSLKDWRFWVLAVAFVPISFAVGGPIPNIENILRSNGFEAGDIVTLASLIGLSVIGGRLIGGWLIDRMWAPGVAFVLLSAPALACWLLAQGTTDPVIAGLSIVLIGFAAGVEYDLMAFMVARYFGLKSYGGIYGALYGFFALGAGIGPVVFGQYFDRTGSYETILLYSAVGLVAGAALLLVMGKYRNFDGDRTDDVAAAERTADGAA